MPSLITRDGARLQYLDEGTGLPLLFLHGCWCSSEFFRSQAKGLSKTHRVIRLDFRAHGLSAGIDSGLSVGTFAEDVRLLVQTLEIDPIFVGWSMGALVIWEYQRRFGPEAVRGSVIVDQPASDFKWSDWPRGFADLEELQRLMERTQTDREALVHEFVDGMFRASPSTATRAWVTREMLLPSPAAASAILFDQTLRDYRADLPGLTPPALICFGRDEKIMPVALGRHLADQMPDARLEIFEASGHCPFIEERERFDSLLVEFAAEVAARPR